MAVATEAPSRAITLQWPLDDEQYVYRPGEAVERLDHPREVSGEPVLAGFVLRLEDIWL